MAIQTRRGLKADLDPSKLLPGEWACTIDSDTKKQTVWMCFAPGMVKQMGTLEDFKQQIKECTQDIRQEYIAEFNEILEQIEALEQQTSANTATVVKINNDIVNTYLPQMLGYVNSSKSNANTATSKAAEATDKAVQASASAASSQSYALGRTGTREGEDTDNAKYYKDQASLLVSSVSNALRPMGTIAFANIPISGNTGGDMYNISDAFTSDVRFKDGSIDYPAGTNIYYTADGHWDCLSGQLADYVMKADFDKMLANSTPKFVEPEGIGKPISGGTFSRFMGTMARLVEHVSTTITTKLNSLVTKMGNTDISAIENGTVTGILVKQNTDITEINDNLSQRELSHITFWGIYPGSDAYGYCYLSIYAPNVINKNFKLGEVLIYNNDATYITNDCSIHKYLDSTLVVQLPKTSLYYTKQIKIDIDIS